MDFPCEKCQPSRVSSPWREPPEEGPPRAVRWGGALIAFAALGLGALAVLLGCVALLTSRGCPPHGAPSGNGWTALELGGPALLVAAAALCAVRWSATARGGLGCGGLALAVLVSLGLLYWALVLLAAGTGGLC